MSRFEYSLGVDILGCLVEVLSGKAAGRVFPHPYLRALGMKDTYFFPPEKNRPAGRRLYLLSGKGLNRFPDTPITEGAFCLFGGLSFPRPEELFSGGAGLVSTAMDYARFCQMMLNGGKAGNTA